MTRCPEVARFDAPSACFVAGRKLFFTFLVAGFVTNVVALSALGSYVELGGAPPPPWGASVPRVVSALLRVGRPRLCCEVHLALVYHLLLLLRLPLHDIGVKQNKQNKFWDRQDINFVIIDISAL